MCGDVVLFDFVIVMVICIVIVVSCMVVFVLVIIDEDFEEQQVINIKDVLCYELGIMVCCIVYCFGSVVFGGGCDGDLSINICGFEGNCVLLMEDGICLLNVFLFGLFEVGCGDYVDFDMFKCIEILCGLVLVFYGSDGLIGVVNFIMKDLCDLLLVYNKFYYFLFWLSYDLIDCSIGVIVLVVGGNDCVQGMIIVDGWCGYEVDMCGGNNMVSMLCMMLNLQDVYLELLFGKFVLMLIMCDMIKFIVEMVQWCVSIDVLLVINVLIMFGFMIYDWFECNCFSVDYDFCDDVFCWFQIVYVQFYYQDVKQD